MNRYILLLLFTCYIFTGCKEFKTSSPLWLFTSMDDSVLFEGCFNPDTLQIKKIIKEQNKDILLAIDGWASGNHFLLRGKGLQDRRMVDELRKYFIIVLYVDERRRFKPSDSLTIGEINFLFQKHNYRVAAQPFYAILHNGQTIRKTGYLPYGEMMDFLKGYNGQWSK